MARPASGVRPPGAHPTGVRPRDRRGAARTPDVTARTGAVLAVVLVIGAAALAVVASAWPPGSYAIAASIATLGVAAVVDARTRRLPDPLVVAALVPLALLAALAPAGSPSEVVTAMLSGTAFAAIPVAALHLVSPAAMGFGDVKAAAAIGATVGLVDPVLALVVVNLAAAGAAIAGLVRRRATVALGPFLVGAAVAVLAVAVLLGVAPEAGIGREAPWR